MNPRLYHGILVYIVRNAVLYSPVSHSPQASHHNSSAIASSLAFKSLPTTKPDKVIRPRLTTASWPHIPGLKRCKCCSAALSACSTRTADNLNTVGPLIKANRFKHKAQTSNLGSHPFGKPIQSVHTSQNLYDLTCCQARNPLIRSIHNRGCHLTLTLDRSIIAHQYGVALEPQGDAAVAALLQSGNGLHLRSMHLHNPHKALISSHTLLLVKSNIRRRMKCKQ